MTVEKVSNHVSLTSVDGGVTFVAERIICKMCSDCNRV